MSKIYVDSIRRDALQKQLPPEPAYLGQCMRPERLMYLECGCIGNSWLRVPRSFWMHLIPFFRLYRCLHCGTRVFRPKIRPRRVSSAGHMVSRVPRTRAAERMHVR